MYLAYQLDGGPEYPLRSNGIDILSVDGLGADVQVNTAELAGYDGANYLSSTLPARTISILLHLSDRGGTVEAHRQLLYRLFRVKTPGTLYVVDDSGKGMKIQCYTEKAPYVLKERTSDMQITLRCPNPYFEGLTDNEQYLTSVVGLFRFPFDFPSCGFKISEKTPNNMSVVLNNSPVDCGMEIVFSASAELTNPYIVNAKTYETAKINATMQAGDELHIITTQGNKSIYLIRNGVRYNYINYMAEDFVFLQLASGKNHFKFSADAGGHSLTVLVRYTEYYSSAYDGAKDTYIYNKDALRMQELEDKVATLSNQQQALQKAMTEYLEQTEGIYARLARRVLGGDYIG